MHPLKMVLRLTTDSYDRKLPIREYRRISTKTGKKQLSLLILIYPRLISFESDRVGGSMRHGWRIERCQPRMAVCAAHLLDHSQNAAGTLGLIGRNETFGYFSSLKSDSA